MRYRAFLSYSHKDRQWARWLHRALESYRPPRKIALDHPGGNPMSPIFRDRDELPSSADLSQAVADALEASDRLIVVCSPAAAASRWVNEEIRTFRKLGRSDRILCIVVDGEPGAGDETECFPPALIESNDEVGEAPEYVAADARSHADGRHNALLKIAAGMLNVGFDTLRQRDLRRRHRRMVGITAASLVISAVTIALAITATLARQEADFRRQQAEQLVDFMLGDLMVSLREIGRLDIYMTIGDMALEYFSEQPDTDVNDRTLTQRARNMRLIGEVRIEQGSLEEALEAFNESLLITTRLADRNPDDAEMQIDLANSIFYVGNVHFLRGDLVQARASFAQVLPIVEALSEGDPENTRWLMELGFAYTNLGRILELEGTFPAALDAYESVMAANRRLVELDPGEDEWELELAFAHNNIGKLIIALGRLAEAEENYRRDLDIKARQFENNPNNNALRSYTAVSQFFLGQLLTDTGQFVEAEEHLTAALENFVYLLSIESTRTSWRGRRGNIERELARLYLTQNALVPGREYLVSSIRTLDELLQDDPENAAWRRELVRSLILGADFESRLARLDAAHSHLGDARTHLADLLEREEVNLDTLGLAIHADICAAQIASTSDPQTATAAARAALDKLDAYFADTSDPRILDLRRRALIQLGREDEVEDIESRLESMGYRIDAG